MSRSPVTCHVLDASKGRPATDVQVELICLGIEGASQPEHSLVELPQKIAAGKTNQDGRCSELLPSDITLAPGVYKMVFHTGPYFQSANVASFYPIVEITFTYSDPSQHYHIPLLLSPFSYTTYRGS